MKISFIPIDYDYFDYEGKNYAKIIGRNESGKRICLIDSCEIYFWAILKPKVSEKKIKEIQEKIEKIKVKNTNRTTIVLKTEVHKKNFLGKSVKAIKIFITNFKDAHDVADKIDFPEIDKRREYDLDFTTKYILDKKLLPLHWYEIEGEVLSNSTEFNGIDSSLEVDICLKGEKIKEIENKTEFSPKILAYDIETDELEIGKGKILMISMVGKNFKKVLTWKKEGKLDYVEKVEDEKEMLEKFIEYLKKYDPDILTGYFSDGFDLPYLRERADKNKIKLNIGVDNSQPIFSRGNVMTGKIKGLVHIDIYRFIKSVYSQYLQSETLSLNEIASELLGERKTEWKHKHSSTIKEKEWETYFEYNLQDSNLTYKLTEKLLPDLIEFTKVIQEPLFNVSRDGMSAHVENYIIHHLEKFNEIIEKRPVYDELSKRMQRQKYEGAFVFQPRPGLYEKICFFDFTSYWPSIIVSFNLSLSTLLSKKEKDSLEVEISGKKVYFSKKSGFFPVILGEIIEKRKQYKQEYAKNPNPFTKARSNAFKLLANASYGYQGFFGARYYCPEASASTTAISRDFIKKTIESINKKEFEVIYSDTDSIAFKLNKHEKKDALKLLEEINKNLPGIMELDLEDFYERGIWVTKRTGDFGAKKKYALINEKGKIKIRGFETVRRDWCDLARVTQNKILELILNEGNSDKALEYLKKVIKEIKKREIPKENLIIRTQLKKSINDYKAISPHVTIAKKMVEKNIPFKTGGLIEYYIGEPKSNKKKSLIRDRAKLPEEPGNYDIDYYLKNQIIPAVENIFDVLNINVMELVEGKKQKSLGDF
jgi:DNA polymerase elongation subunit (family B)